MTTKQKLMENKFEDLKVLYQSKIDKSGCKIERNMLFTIGRS